jgi:hypothetical protein
VEPSQKKKKEGKKENQTKEWIVSVSGDRSQSSKCLIFSKRQGDG